MKTSEVLRKAADEIRRRGWIQEDLGSDLTNPRDCSVCAWGAINAAANGDPWAWWVEDGPANEHPALHALASVVTGNEYGSVPSWNDDLDRTVEEVLDAFERAAQAAELEELASE